VHPLSSHEASLSSGEASVRTEEAPESTEGAPVSSDGARILIRDAPIFCRDAPVVTGDTPIRSGDAPISSGDAPLRSEVAAVLTGDALLENERQSLKIAAAPLDFPDTSAATGEPPATDVDFFAESTSDLERLRASQEKRRGPMRKIPTSLAYPLEGSWSRAESARTPG
jgi:hypothetical protein